MTSVVQKATQRKADKRNKSIIPRRAIFDPRMKQHPAVLPMLSNIGSYTNRDGKATVGQARLAEDFGISQQAASKLTKKLVEWGYLAAATVPNPQRPGRTITEWTMLYDDPAPDEADDPYALRSAADAAIAWLTDVTDLSLDEDAWAKKDAEAWMIGSLRYQSLRPMKPPAHVVARWERMRAIGERVARDPHFAAEYDAHRKALRYYRNDVENLWCWLTRDTGDPKQDYTLLDAMDESEWDARFAEAEDEEARTARPEQLFGAINNFRHRYDCALHHGDEDDAILMRATEAALASMRRAAA